jgi:hypothetical protein
MDRGNEVEDKPKYGFEIWTQLSVICCSQKKKNDTQWKLQFRQPTYPSPDSNAGPLKSVERMYRIHHDSQHGSFLSIPH